MALSEIAIPAYVCDVCRSTFLSRADAAKNGCEAGIPEQKFSVGQQIFAKGRLVCGTAEAMAIYKLPSKVVNVALVKASDGGVVSHDWTMTLEFVGKQPADGDFKYELLGPQTQSELLQLNG